MQSLLNLSIGSNRFTYFLDKIFFLSMLKIFNFLIFPQHFLSVTPNQVMSYKWFRTPPYEEACNKVNRRQLN